MSKYDKILLHRRSGFKEACFIKHLLAINYYGKSVRYLYITVVDIFFWGGGLLAS